MENSQYSADYLQARWATRRRLYGYSIYLFQTTRSHNKQRTEDRKMTKYKRKTDRNTLKYMYRKVQF